MPPETFVDAAVAQEDGQALARQRRVPSAPFPDRLGATRYRSAPHAASTSSRSCGVIAAMRGPKP